jgi:hypothetical protein
MKKEVSPGESSPQGTIISLTLAVPDTPVAVTWYQKTLRARVLWSVGSVAGLEGALFRGPLKLPISPLEDNAHELPFVFELLPWNDVEPCQRIGDVDSVGLHAKDGDAMVLQSVELQNRNRKAGALQLLEVFESTVFGQ